jgi:hypothetical protein
MHHTQSNGKKSQPLLERTTFRISREMEYFTEKELTMQIGHSQATWPLALVKELIDNALDACETAEMPPVIEVAFGNDWPCSSGRDSKSSRVCRSQTVIAPRAACVANQASSALSATTLPSPRSLASRKSSGPEG